MKTLKQAKFCLHCGETVQDDPPSTFCCAGCEMVYEFIQAKGLGHYYEIQDQFGSRGRPARYLAEDFSYLSEPDFVSSYSKFSNGCTEMQFYLEGVHCSACVWVVEKLATVVDGIERVRLDLGNHVATVTSSSSDELGSFSKIAEEMSKLGYRPHPVKDGSEELLLRIENRRLLARVAVAGACAGNIMLLAISLYSGLGGNMAVWFDRISAFLFLPVLFYSATPLLKSAWASVAKKAVSIDVPVAIGIVLGSTTSYVNLLLGSHELYFDSLSTLVFLLLASRYLLRRMQQTSLGQSMLLRFITPSSARRVSRSSVALSEPEIVRVESLRRGDKVEVQAGETAPCDGLVVSGTAAIDVALLTGESRPETLKSGDKLYAGTVNRSGCLVVEVQELGYETRLGQILKSAEANLANKAQILSFSDRIARKFTLGLLVLIAGVFFYRIFSGGWANWNLALNQALALSLVACPCAFALAAPLAMSTTIGKLARNRILVKGSDSLEKLALVREVFIDKTGTLTEGELQVRSWQVEIPGLARAVSRAVCAIESHSNHPTARALVRYFEKNGFASNPVEDFVENLGQGVSARFEGHYYVISADRESGGIIVKRDGIRVATGRLVDGLRGDSHKAVEALQKLGLEVSILSGDHLSAVAETASRLGIWQSHVYSAVSPEDKAQILKKHPYAMMVGDGANDATALASAYVGVAVHNGAEISLRTSDIYSCEPGVRSIAKLIVAGQETLRVIHRNFAMSLIYNTVAAIGAVMGIIHPLFAAILMPIGAFTLFISSIAGTSRLRAALRKDPLA